MEVDLYERKRNQKCRSIDDVGQEDANSASAADGNRQEESFEAGRLAGTSREFNLPEGGYLSNPSSPESGYLSNPSSQLCPATGSLIKQSNANMHDPLSNLAFESQVEDCTAAPFQTQYLLK